MLSTRLTEPYGLETPLISTGMAFVALPEFVAAVSNVGGVGQLGVGPSPPSAMQAMIQGGHHIAQQNKEARDRKLLLERSVQQMVDALKRWSNGDTSARIVLTQDSVLREVGGAINNLLGRIQRMRQESSMLQKIMDVMNRFYDARMNSKGDTIDWEPTNTPVDTLVKQHNFQMRQIKQNGEFTISDNQRQAISKPSPNRQTFTLRDFNNG